MKSKIPNKLLKNLDLDTKDVEHIIKNSFTLSTIIVIGAMVITQFILTYLYSLDLLFMGNEIIFKHVFLTYSTFLFFLIILCSIFVQGNKYFIFTPSHMYKIKAPFLFRLFPNLFNVFHVSYEDIIGLKVKKANFIRININKDLNSSVIGGVKYISVKDIIIQLERKYRGEFNEFVNFICEKAFLERDPTQKDIYIK
ncbi:MAG: hypothetical protein ACTSR7_19705 [Promethearchaeota archaeon]